MRITDEESTDVLNFYKWKEWFLKRLDEFESQALAVFSHKTKGFGYKTRKMVQSLVQIAVGPQIPSLTSYNQAQGIYFLEKLH